MQSKDSHKLVLLLCVLGLIACALAASVKHVQMQDVDIYDNGADWICDRIICPPKTDRCHVSKSKPSLDGTVLVRENTCYSKENDVLVHKTFEETIGANQQVSLSIDSFRNGGSMIQNSNNIQSIAGNHIDKELDIQFGNIDRVNQNIENNVQSINRAVQEQLQELQRQLQQTFSNIF